MTTSNIIELSQRRSHIYLESVSCLEMTFIVAAILEIIFKLFFSRNIYTGSASYNGQKFVNKEVIFIILTLKSSAEKNRNGFVCSLLVCCYILNEQNILVIP